MCQASEIFAYSNEKIYTEFGLTRGGVAFFKGDTHLMTCALWPCADRVEALFKTSQSDHDGLGNVVSRCKTSVGAVKFDWD